MKRLLLGAVFCTINLMAPDVDIMTMGASHKKSPGRSDLAVQQAVDRGDALFRKPFDKKKKEKEVKGLVERSVEYLKNNDLTKACATFARKKEFILGDTYIFVLDMDGRILFHGEEPTLELGDHFDDKDSFGYLYIQAMIEMAKKGGGWVTYSWRDAIKDSYVALVKKGNESFVIGAGYYPHDKEDHVVSMVKGGVALFKKTIDQGYPVTEPFSTMNYPLKSGFSVGDLYLYAIGFDGKVYAHADRPNLVGKNQLNDRDTNGRYTTKETIAALKEAAGPVWVEYMSKGTNKKTYVEQVVDKQGNNYFIACGYYPEADRQAAEDLVGRASQYLEGSGKSAGILAFGSHEDDTYRFGDLYIVLYDLKGKILSHGWNEELKNDNVYLDKDQDGRFYVQELLAQAADGGGWVNYKIQGSFQSTYVEQVDLGVEKLVIACSFYPISKGETIDLLVSSAITALKSGDLFSTLHSFTEIEGSFIRGDLKVFVIDTNGICYAWGDNYRMIWKNLKDWKDQNGQPFIQQIIEATTSGPARIGYTFNGLQAVASVDRVEKDGKTYIVGSSFYF
jgi:cytochrome c